MRAIVAGKGLTAVGATWQLVVPGSGFAQVRIEVAPAEIPAARAEPRSAARLAAPDAPVRRIELGAPGVTERAQLAALNAAPAAVRLPTGADPRKSRLLAIGFPRALPVESHSIGLASLAWQVLPAGNRAARIEVVAPGAAALRLSVSLAVAAPDLVVRFASAGPSADVHGPYPAVAIADAVTRHGAYWSPVLDGDVALVEIVAGSGVALEDNALRLHMLSHLVVAPWSARGAEPSRASDIGGSGACNVDVACALQTGGAAGHALRTRG